MKAIATYQVRNAGSLGAAVPEVNRVRYVVRLAKDLPLSQGSDLLCDFAALREIGLDLRPTTSSLRLAALDKTDALAKALKPAKKRDGARFLRLNYNGPQGHSIAE